MKNELYFVGSFVRSFGCSSAGWPCGAIYITNRSIDISGWWHLEEIIILPNALLRALTQEQMSNRAVRVHVRVTSRHGYAHPSSGKVKLSVINHSACWWRWCNNCFGGELEQFCVFVVVAAADGQIDVYKT